jgi:hypothetical protein
MALIEDSKGRQDPNSGYGRVFGNDDLGRLISRVHVCSIRNGLELEAILWQATPYKSNLHRVLGRGLPLIQQDIHVVSGSLIAEYHRETNRNVSSISLNEEGIEVKEQSGRKLPITDILILDNRNNTMYVVELKDGDTFDTKKANGEIASAHSFTNWISPQVSCRVRYYFCAFNQDNKQSIVDGIKGRFDIEEVLTGRELCEIIGINYDEIRQSREGDQMANKQYFVEQLLAIPEIRELIRIR